MLSAHRSKRARLTGNWDDLKAVKACAVCSAKFGVTRHKYHCRVRAWACALHDVIAWL